MALSRHHGARRAPSPLELVLIRARRREEPAWLLVLDVHGRARLDALASCFRATDGVVAARAGRIITVHAALEVAADPREQVELRLARVLGGCTARTGWAAFPEEALTVPELLIVARARRRDLVLAPGERHGEALSPGLAEAG